MPFRLTPLFLLSNIHEAAARNEYLKWDGETVRRILSFDRSFISELNLCVALVKYVRMTFYNFDTKRQTIFSSWQQSVQDPLEPGRKEMFEQMLLPLIRFPSMSLVAFSRVIGLNVLPQSETKRLRRYIVNPNPRRYVVAKDTLTYTAVYFHFFFWCRIEEIRASTATLRDLWTSFHSNIFCTRSVD